MGIKDNNGRMVKVVLVNDTEVRLTNTEFEILYLLASNTGKDV